MGVVNVTPDSFSDGGCYFSVDAAVAHAAAVAGAGADVLDIGGESSRPGAPTISAAEQIRRVVPVIRQLRQQQIMLPISIDTCDAEVAAAAIAAGADIINDISGFCADAQMPAVARDTGAGCVIMHRRGTAINMQQHTDYTDLVGEIRQWLQQRLAALVDAGIAATRIMLDPGIGFSKTCEQNLVLIRHSAALRQLGRPVLVGPSRKSFIGTLTGESVPANRQWGTAAAVTACILYGADVVRVHDLAAMKQVAAVADALRNPGTNPEST